MIVQKNPASVSRPDATAAIPARGRQRASQASCCCGSATAATKVMILDGAVGWAGERRPRVAVADPARGLGIDLVAAGHARDLLAREQDEVERRGGEPDQRLDPAPQGELSWGAMRHGARL